MPATAHAHHTHHHPAIVRPPADLNRIAWQATLHCLTGCAIGEVSGLVIGAALGWSVWPTIALAVTLAFLFGFALTALPLLRAGIPTAEALKLAFVADFASITIMEFVDNATMLLIPGVMDVGLADPLFWGSMAGALALAAVAAFPVNRWLIARGQGHAIIHARHIH